MNGYSNGPQPGGTGAFRGGDANPRAGSYPPMAEIVSTVEEKVNGLRQHSIRRILEEAKQIFSTAKGTLSTRKNLAAAYWAFLVAYTLVVEAIPSHREYIDKIAQSRSQMHRDYRQLSSVRIPTTSRQPCIARSMLTLYRRFCLTKPSSRTLKRSSQMTTREMGHNISPHEHRRSHLLLLPYTPTAPARRRQRQGRLCPSETMS
jgi:ubiquitin carboxyl-terminal hydrolase 8